MHTIQLSEDELRIVRTALQSYLDDFGHEEADVLRAIKATIAKLAAAAPPDAADAGGLTPARLSALLREAERAHGEYERELGRRDEDWPEWYAQYVLDRVAGA
jgi:hypothetical protein